MASLSTFLRGFPKGVAEPKVGRQEQIWFNGAMSQSLLYHAFGIPKVYRYVRTEYQQGAVWFTVQPAVKPDCCPHCQSKDFIGHGQRERKVRMVPIGLKPVWLKVGVPRYRCKGCGQTWEVSPPLSGHMSTSVDNSNGM